MAESQEPGRSQQEHRVVIVGAGFAGLQRRAGAGPAGGRHDRDRGDQSTDYFLYLPLMPQVAGGVVEPRHICVSLPRRLRGIRFVLGTVSTSTPSRRW